MSAAKTLCLIASNPKYLTTKGRTVLNAGVSECLKLGWIAYAPKKNLGYMLTAKGKVVMSSMRTGVPTTKT